VFSNLCCRLALIKNHIMVLQMGGWLQQHIWVWVALKLTGTDVLHLCVHGCGLSLCGMVAVSVPCS